MRCSLLVLFLALGTAAFGQAGPESPFGSEQVIQKPFPWTSKGPDFGKLPPQRWDLARSPSWTSVLETPPPKPNVLLGDARIDPSFVVHPLQSQVGAVQEGKLVAQNLYPGLTFQRIDGSSSAPKVGPLSTTWPRLKVHEIPTRWPKLKMEMVGTGSVPKELTAGPSSR